MQKFVCPFCGYENRRRGEYCVVCHNSMRAPVLSPSPSPSGNRTSRAGWARLFLAASGAAAAVWALKVLSEKFG